MKRPRSVLLAVAVLCSGCSGSLPDQIKVQGSLPQGTRAIAIRPVPMQLGAAKNVEGVSDASVEFARFLKDALAHKQPTWLVELWQEQTKTAATDLIVNAEVLEIEGGSRAARFWIGLGAGAAHSTVQVSILDRAANEIASARISEATVCPIGWCVKANKEVIQQDLQILAGKAAEFIVNPAEFERKRGAQ